MSARASISRPGYTMVTLLVFLSILVIGLLVAVPVWETQIRRESEEELIFRGNQFVEAVRLFEKRNPGTFPKDIDDLVKKRCLRRHFRDPMTKEGKWYLITRAQGPGAPGRMTTSPRRGSFFPPGTAAGGTRPGSVSDAFSTAGGAGGATIQLTLIPEDAVAGAPPNTRIIGVASMSDRESIRVLDEATRYSEWLFYFGKDPNVKPEVTIYGRDEKSESGR